MKKLLLTAVVVLLPSSGFSRDSDNGLTVHKNSDHATALQEWQPLAEQGVAQAQSKLGLMYYRGDGVRQDVAKAVSWYKLAAEQELAEAQYKLGLIHLIGDGVLQNLVLACMWFDIAAANGYNDGSTFRDDITKYMTPADISEAQSRASVCMESDYQDCD